MRRFTPLLLALSMLLATLFPAVAAPQVDASDNALAWLGTKVLADGGFSDGFSEGSNPGATIEALFAAIAAGQDPTAWGTDRSPLDYLAAQAPSASKTGELSRLILVTRALGQEPTTFGGVNLVQKLTALYDGDTGLFAGTVPEHAFAMLAHRALGIAIPQAATDALLGLQGDDGGWAFSGTGQSDTNTTALVLQTLVAANQATDSQPITTALAYLKSQQNQDGGFPYQNPSDYGTESDANSTAWVIQGLLATNQALGDWKNPEAFLASLQNKDGSFAWKAEVPGANFLATAQAVPALEGVTFVALPTVQVAKNPAPAPEAPPTLPNTGSPATTPWGTMLAAGAALLLGGLTARRRLAPIR